jgi:endogenous inhibitor of DNA gyrase (YacG/DUF329 family)
MSKLLKQECPYCEGASVYPKRDVIRGERDGKTYECPNCGDPVAFAGEWTVIARGVDLQEYEEMLKEREE